MAGKAEVLDSTVAVEGGCQCTVCDPWRGTPARDIVGTWETLELRTASRDTEVPVGPPWAQNVVRGQDHGRWAECYPLGVLLVGEQGGWHGCGLLQEEVPLTVDLAQALTLMLGTRPPVAWPGSRPPLPPS